jgi:N-acetylmuramoyl-L-alanine amidase
MKILIDNGHGQETAGKRSPDGRLLEWSYNREIARRVVTSLLSIGIDAELLVPEDEDISLAERCRRVNLLCSQLGTRNVALVSIHVNAAGRGDKWYNAEGWCCYTSPGQTAGDLLANHLCQAALQNLPGHRMRFDYTDGDADQEAAFYILRHTACAASLTENGFMDCHRSCDFLLSDEGKDAITQLHIDGILSYVRACV